MIISDDSISALIYICSFMLNVKIAVGLVLNLSIIFFYFTDDCNFKSQYLQIIFSSFLLQIPHSLSLHSVPIFLLMLAELKWCSQ